MVFCCVASNNQAKKNFMGIIVVGIFLLMVKLILLLTIQTYSSYVVVIVNMESGRA